MSFFQFLFLQPIGITVFKSSTFRLQKYKLFLKQTKVNFKNMSIWQKAKKIFITVWGELT